MRKKYHLSIKLHDTGEYGIVKENGTYKVHATNIVNTFECYWLGTCDGYAISNKDLKNIGLGSMLNLKSSEIQDKTFYRFPDLSLPRQKVDLLKEKYNIKVTRKLDVADYKIISKRYLNKIITTSWHTDYNKSFVYDFMKQAKEQNLLSNSALNAFRMILEDTPSDAMFRIDLNSWGGYNSTTNFSKTELAARDQFTSEIKGLADGHFNGNMKSMLIGNDTTDARKNDVSMFNSFIGCSNVVLDETMIDIIDEGLAVLESDQYDDIEKMITCSSIDDRSVALEMLANCNVNKSFDIVSGMYWWHYDWMKNTNNWNTVNVKTLRTQMKRYEGGHADNGIWSFNNYLKNLAEEGKLTKFAVDKTRERLYSTLLSSYVGPSSDIFKISLDSIELEDKFKTNVIDE